MNWDNETVLKFLELYQMNSCIWDPQNESHKNRQCVNDAWNNIKENLGTTCTIKDLKKKKESLMSAYRNYRTKIKKSERSGSGSSDVYQPTWFAFSYMDSFLGSIYTCNTTISTEGEETTEDTDTTNTNRTDELNESNPTTSNQESSSMNPSTSNQESSSMNPSTSNQESSFMTPTPPVRRRQRNPPELIEAKQHMEQAFNFMKQVSKEHHHPKHEDDECTIFGQLIARKIRKLSEERRDVMMVKINQLFVDEHMLNSPRPYSSTTTYTPSPPMFQEVYLPTEEFQQTPTAAKEEFQQTQTASTEEFQQTPTAAREEFQQTQTDFPSYRNPSYGGSAELIIPNTIYDGPANSFQNLLIFKKK